MGSCLSKELALSLDRRGHRAIAFQFEGFLFFIKVFKESRGGNLTVDVVMKGSKEECRGFVIKVSMKDMKSGKGDGMPFKPKATFPPRPLEKEYKEGYCLSVPEEAMSELWKYNEDEGGYTFGYHIKIVKLG